MDSLVFSEHVVHAVSNLKDLDWDLGDPEPRDWLGFQLARDHGFTRPKNHRPEWPAKGPRSLFMLALETAAKNIQNIDDYWLESIAKPEWIKMMWRYLRPEDGELSLAAWKKFNKFLPDDPEWGTQLAFNYKQIRVPTAADFAIYTKPLTSTASFDFVAHLRISGLCPIKPQNLILLAGLKNLGVLEVIEQFDAAASFPGAVSDRVVKSWSCQEDPFPRLRILKVCSFHDLTLECLRYLDKFPKLALFEVLGRAKNWRGAELQARKHGWAYHRTINRRHPSRSLSSLPEDFSCRQAPYDLLSETFAHHLGHTYLEPHQAMSAYRTLKCLPDDTTTDESAGYDVPPRTQPKQTREQQPTRRQPPFASLHLGDDPRPGDAPAFWRQYRLRAMFFWRQSLVPGPEAPAGSSKSEFGSARAAAGDEERCSTVASNSAGKRSASRPTKRHRTNGIGNMLHDFQS